jgi:hypothetical protein
LITKSLGKAADDKKVTVSENELLGIRDVLGLGEMNATTLIGKVHS